MSIAFLQANPALTLLIGGLIIGGAFGAISLRSGFCVMGAVSDATLFGDLRRLRMIALAAAVAVMLTTLARVAGLADVTKSFYLTSTFDWLGAAAGGLLFGIGMVLAGGCISRCLVRSGTGDLRAVITALVTGLAAYMTMGGVLGWPRDMVQSVSRVDLVPFGLSAQGLPDVLVTMTAVAPLVALAAATIVVVGLLSLFVLAATASRPSPAQIFAAVAIGALVAVAWTLTSLASDDLAVSPTAVQAISFVRPTGDAIEWLARATALGLPNFGAATVFGTIAGGTIAALISGRFRLCGFTDLADLKRHLAGGLLMGVGGVLALGCSIGNGLTGISVLSLSAFLATFAILLGARLCLQWLERSA